MGEARVGPFRLRRKIGSGGMGEVWEAVPVAGGPAVALKWNSPASSIARFMEEVRLSRSLNHPHIVKALDSGVDGGRPWIALELLDGATLSQLRKQHDRPWPPGLVVELGMQALAALGAVHGEAGTPSIIHRDIKPSNLFLCRDGTLRLIDFGIALSDDADRTQTRSGTVVASVRYSSPEQARGERVDLRTDLFSLGLVLTELLVGRRVYDQPDDVGVLSALLFQPSPRPGGLVASLPPRLEEALASALRSSPEARPRSASALRDALASSLDGPSWTLADVAAWAAPLIERCQSERGGDASAVAEGAPERAHTSTRPTTPARPTRLPPPKRRQRPFAVAAVLALGLAAAALVTRVRGGDDSPPATAVQPESAPAAAAAAAAAVTATDPDDPEAGSSHPSVPTEAVALPAAAAAPEPSRPVRSSAARTSPRTQVKGTGWLSVGVSKGWATVAIDGKPAGETPLFRVEVPAGTHTVKAVAHDGKSWTRRIRVNARRESKVIFER